VLGPYPVKYAREWVELTHRRIPQLTGAMWCVGLWVDDVMRGLAVVGRPNARNMDVLARHRIHTLCVLRVAVIEGTHNGCSALYGACSRAAKAQGADGLCTYIHDDETGVSLRASGWRKDATPTSGGEHDRPSRKRKPALDAKPKWRWWAPWSTALSAPSPATTETDATCTPDDGAKERR
jgi:hypothetical protein